MIRNLKVLGLALGAMLALGAVVASVASAQHPAGTGVLTSTGPVTLTGTDSGVNRFLDEPEGTEIKCPESTYTGHATLTTKQTGEGKKHEFLQNGATSVTVTPHYRKLTAGGKINCTAGGLPATVTMNGCDYDFDDFTTKPATDIYTFTVDVVCPAEQVIDVHVYSGEGEGIKLCTITVFPQTGLLGGEATHDTVGDDVKLFGTIKGITSTQEGICGHKHFANSQYEINVTVKGHNEAGTDTPVTITDQ